ncbi:MAG: hypothetical protein HRU14_09055, partial [Planctomycetes bacterium]|nr:hypothetical protein [Planctomycetota bacterium]
TGAKVCLLTQPSIYRERMSLEENDVLVFRKFIFLTEKSFFEQEIPTTRSLRDAMAAYNAVTTRVAQQSNVPLIDVASQIDKTLDNFLDDCHYTKRVAEKFAKFLAKRLVAEGVLQ